MKSIQAAIAVSKQPGYFDYYVAPEDVKEIERKKILNSLAREVGQINEALNQLNEEIERAELAARGKPKDLPELRNLSQWFDLYGKPNMNEEKEKMLTSYKVDSKIYGGTQHYSSFKTKSLKMVKGRLTR